MQRTFFTADTHFWHMNRHGGIIKYCNRPYSSIEEMNEDLVAKWNAKVPPNGLVYHLGDFAFAKKDQIVELTKRLHGSIILVEGNHDRIGNANSFGFMAKQKRMDIKIEGIYITLSHFAMRVWDKSHFNSWHCYGHSHGCLEPEGKSWDVGVDYNNYQPIEFDELREIMNNRPDNFNWVERLRGFDKTEFEEARKTEMI